MEKAKKKIVMGAPVRINENSFRIAAKTKIEPKTEHIEPVTDDQIISIVDAPRTLSTLTDAVLNGIFGNVKKPVIVSTPRPAYSWSAQRFNDGYLQPSGSTKDERYPKIYDSAAQLKPKAKRILSFGCSTGEEVFSLAKRFPNAEQLIGVDIDYNRVCTARRTNKQKNIFFHDNVGGLGQFDVVTALNVFFCLENPIPKEQWKKTLEEVSGYVAPSGVLLIFKSDYDPMEVLSTDFKAENCWNHTHNRNNKDYFCGYFRKKRKLW